MQHIASYWTFILACTGTGQATCTNSDVPCNHFIVGVDHCKKCLYQHCFLSAMDEGTESMGLTDHACDICTFCPFLASLWVLMAICFHRIDTSNYQ